MDVVSTNLNKALERALTRDGPINSPADLLAKSKSDIEAAVREALADPQLIQALIDPELKTLLMLDMAADGKAEQVLDAINRGANLNARNPSGETALLLATKNGARSCVRILLDAGADFSLASEKGTALHVAATNGDEETALLLIDAGADPRAADPSGETVLGLMDADWMEQYSVFAHYAEQHKARKEAAARLRAYIEGRMGRTSWPPYYASRPWSEASHRYMPPAFRETARDLVRHDLISPLHHTFC